MMPANDQNDIYLEIEQQLDVLKRMQEQVTYEIARKKQRTLLEAAAEKIPMLAHLLKRAGETGEAAAKLGEQADFFHKGSASSSISSGFHFGAVGIAAFDFLRIPFIYLSAYLLGEKIPMSLNNNAKWVYAGVILGLAIASVAAPVTAPVIAFVILGLTFVMSVFVLGKMLIEENHLKQQSRGVKRELHNELYEMDLIQLDAERLQNNLGDAREEAHIAFIFQEIELLQERYDAQKEVIEGLKNKEFRLSQQLSEINTPKILDRATAICFSTIALVGLVVAIYLPPIGLAILAGVAIAGSAYAVARILVPLIIQCVKWLSSKPQPIEAVEEEDVGDKPLVDNVHVHESTADVFNQLKNKEIVEVEEVLNPPVHNKLNILDPVLTHKKTLVNLKALEDEDEGDGDNDSEHFGQH